ncbi:MAG: hypothetical protein AAFX94_08320, partial [Myxococcota bacterium]
AFVYPPMVVWLLLERRRERRPLGGLPLVAGLAILVVLVSAWLVPMATSDAFGQLQSTGASEVLSRTPAGTGVGGFLWGLVRFPVEVGANLLPWSLLILWALIQRHSVLDRWRDNAIFRFSAVCFGWVCVLLWLMPGSLGRYVMPAYPFFAVMVATLLAEERAESRRWEPLWYVLGVAWFAFAGYRAWTKPDVLLVLPAIVATAAVALAVGARQVGPVSKGLALMGFLYALFFATIHAPSRGGWDRDRLVEIGRMADTIRSDAEQRGLALDEINLGCSHGVNQAVCFELMRIFDRSMSRPERHSGPSYSVGHVERSPRPAGRTPLGENRFGLELWYLNAPAPR